MKRLKMNSLIRPVLVQLFAILFYAEKSNQSILPWKLNISVASGSSSINGTFVLTFGLPDQLDQNFSASFQPGKSYSLSGHLLTAEERRPNSVRFSLKVSSCSSRPVLKLKKLWFTFIFRNKTFRTEMEKVDVEGFCDYQSEPKGVVANGFLWIETNDCFYHYDYISHEDSIYRGCEAVCKCNNGTVECISSCPPKLPVDPNVCRLAMAAGRCCEVAECFEEVQNRFCDSKRTNFSPFKSSQSYPWTVLLHSWKRGSCLATIIDKHWLITPGYCVERPELTLILYPVNDVHRQWRIENVFFSPNVSYGGVEVKKTLALVKLKRPIIFSETVHRLNLPWMGICGNYLRSDCSLRISSFAGANRNGFEPELVKKVETYRCFDSFYRDNVSSYAEICFKKEKQSHSCPAEDGGAIVVNSGHFYYMVGMVRKFYPDPCSQPTDRRPESYIKAESICPYLSWIYSYTGLH